MIPVYKELEHDFYHAIEIFALENYHCQFLSLSLPATNHGALALFQYEGYRLLEVVYGLAKLSKNIKNESKHLNKTPKN